MYKFKFYFMYLWYLKGFTQGPSILYYNIQYVYSDYALSTILGTHHCTSQSRLKFQSDDLLLLVVFNSVASNI